MKKDCAGRIETTMGELIEVVSEAALPTSGKPKREVYLIASLALNEILKKAPLNRPPESGRSVTVH
ncbi:MAG TPA: hypothetical protein VNM15_05965 [Candidatus Binatia bacterium]|nr:hypothetical protein [Candidatus Binatia bacterium]